MNIYLNNVKENWIIDRVRRDWYKHKKNISTHFISRSEIIWILSPWVWNKIPRKYLKEKKVLCSHYHFNFDSFDKEDFIELDSFVDQYHVISQKTKKQLSKLTEKKITSIPFWVNQNNFYHIENKINLRKKLGFRGQDYLIGSFQRDTESNDLSSPKLIKGPDIFLKIVNEIYQKNSNMRIVLAGKNRQFLISEFEKLNIPYKYFEMVNPSKLNDLYNILDLYLVTSRIEGGPQAIMEASITRTPILSTDVGVASEILHENSIFDVNKFSESIPNVDHAYENSLEFTIPSGLNKFDSIFTEIYES